MQKGHHLYFKCVSCQSPVYFSLFNSGEDEAPIICSSCKREYLFDDPNLRRQLSKFEALCMQILESEEILGDTSVGIDIEEHHVKIPYRLLLTRFNSVIDLVVDNQPLSIQFRIEPKEDLKKERTRL